MVQLHLYSCFLCTDNGQGSLESFDRHEFEYLVLDDKNKNSVDENEDG